MMHLMNSAMMPIDGHYAKRTLTAQEFVQMFRGPWKSYIGYPDTANFLSELTGTKIPVSRAETNLESGDHMLVARLKYRAGNPATKKDVKKLAEEDFEFSLIEFSKQ